MVIGERASKTFLIADDEPGIREILRRYFTQKGVRVVVAEDGWEALKMVEREKPDLLLLDMSMPGMDGISVLKKLKGIAPDMPVIMMTGGVDEVEAKQAMSLGARDFLKKPLDLDYLDMSSTWLSWGTK